MKKLFLITIGFTSMAFGRLNAQKEQPKLVVGVVIDQMCYDYLYRFYNQFGTGGFKRLMDQGSHFRNVTYNYVPTFTGPGHASIYTGTTPSNHGIVANDWYHRPYQKDVNCVDDTTVVGVGSDSPDGKCSPHFLRANTITDQLRLTYPNSKVIGVSIKDRSAILPAGHLANGAYWYDYSTGKMITSSFYLSQLPVWVSQYYANNPIENYLKNTWTLSRDSAAYTHYSEDNSPYETLLGGKLAPVFPYDFTQLPKDQQLINFTAMPFANTYLTDFAIQALKGEQLGRNKTTDFLTISYSTPDIAGHAFGPYSLEMEDMYFRLDAELARLFAALDKQVGKGEYVVFLTADHAVVPVPQYLTDHKLPGGYLFLEGLEQSLRMACLKSFGADGIDRIANDNVYFKKEWLTNPQFPQMLQLVKQIILQHDEIKAVYTADELQGVPSDLWMRMVAAGYDRERSGELLFILQPGYLPKTADVPSAHKGTSHGSAFNYDTHVPVLFYGKNIPKQDVFTAYEIVDIAATLVHILEVQRPNAMVGKPMVELFKIKK
jgi:hypothetical protein